MGETIFPGGVKVNGSIKTNQGSIAGLHGEYLQRVDDESYEPAQVGVEYFSPDQQGGIYGKVIRQYFNETITTGDLGEAELVATGVTRVINAGGSLINSSDTGNIISAGMYSSADSNSYFHLTASSGLLRVIINGTFDDVDDSYELWVDYILETEPALSPTGQPFADPSSPLMKRVDTGVYEIPQDEVEYVSKDQAFGGGTSEVRCMRFDIASPTKGAWTSFPTQPSETPTSVFQYKGHIDLLSARFSLPYSTTNNAYLIQVNITSGDIQYYVGSSVTGNFYIWVYYI